MKIALICTEKLPVPPVAGGAIQLYIDGILPYLSKKHDITVFCVQHPDLPNEEVKDNVKFIRVPVPNRASYIANVKARLTADFDKIVIFNRPLWVLPLSKDLPNVRFGLSLHNEMMLPEKIPELQGAQCIERVDVINTVSSFIANGVAARFPQAESKLNVLYSGVDINKYTPVWTPEGLQHKRQLKEKFGIPNHRVVLFVGRLSVKKGVDILIKAMQRVMENHDDVALAVIGSKWFGKNDPNEYTVALQNLAANLKGPVIFTGFLPPARIPPYYNLGDIFVCSSQWNEPLARVHYEAMAAGLPIITTNRGGNAEILVKGKNGLLLEDIDGTRNCSSPEYMAENIEFLLNNPQKALQMGKKGRKFAEEKYAWERVAMDFHNSLYKNSDHVPEPIVESPKPAKEPVIQKKNISESIVFEEDFF
ncbi:MAG: glycosyltransferase family 4 protein [Clostridia bacterium]|nr:glycosyltransferase family 4 protein [Clostridia bacterium]